LIFAVSDTSRVAHKTAKAGEKICTFEIRIIFVRLCRGWHCHAGQTGSAGLVVLLGDVAALGLACHLDDPADNEAIEISRWWVLEVLKNTRPDYRENRNGGLKDGIGRAKPSVI
jgi:hypothetical protein